MKFSIVTICYNDLEGLKTTFKSVVYQTCSDYEYIVIDGGSVDGSIEYLKQNEDKIKYWVSEKDNGVYDAQNKGLEYANGEYCLFLNSGDSLVNESILQKIVDSDKNADIIYGDVYLIKDEKKIAIKKHPDNLSTRFLLVDTICHQAQLIKTSLLKKAGGYNLNYSLLADYEFVVKAIKKNNASTSHLPYIIANYDISGITTNTNHHSQMAMERAHVHDLYFSKTLVKLYRFYVYIMNSYFGRSSMIKPLILFFRNIVFKIYK